jgi:hypothetical protein
MDRYMIVRIITDEDGVFHITTTRGPMTSLETAKVELRVEARTFSNAWPQDGEDDFDDYFNENQTSWGPYWKDKRREVWCIVRTTPGFDVTFVPYLPE